VSETTTIRVSRRTLEALERLREKLHAESLDETIQLLVKKQRKTVLDKSFSVDKDRIESFVEGDRGEDRS